MKPPTTLSELKELRRLGNGTPEEIKQADERLREIVGSMSRDARMRGTRSRAASRGKELKKAATADGVTTCEGCGWSVPERIGNRAMHLHHVVPVAMGGNNRHDNLVVICPNCHVIAHALLDRLHDRAPRNREALLSALRNDPLTLLRGR